MPTQTTHSPPTNPKKPPPPIYPAITFSGVEEISPPSILPELSPDIQLVPMKTLGLLSWAVWRYAIPFLRPYVVTLPPPFPLNIFKRTPWGCVLTFRTNIPCWLRVQLRRSGKKRWLTHSQDYKDGTEYQIAVMNRRYARKSRDYSNSFKGSYEFRGQAWDPKTKKYAYGAILTYKFP